MIMSTVAVAFTVSSVVVASRVAAALIFTTVSTVTDCQKVSRKVLQNLHIVSKCGSTGAGGPLPPNSMTSHVL